MKAHTNLMSYLTLAGLLSVSGLIFANSQAKSQFETGFTHYQHKQYELAIPPLENAVKLEPENAEYHHILAKSYGREAEQANWFSAISLAKKTLKHLEIAANLDKHNIEILDDLMDYYREAPGFLGVDSKKADEIEDLIEKLSHIENKSNIAPTKS